MMLKTLPSIPGIRERVVFRPTTGAGVDLMQPSDPVNLIFVGDADPLRIRTTLLSLSVDRDPRWRTVTGRAARWHDAIGHLHTAYALGQGWSAGAIQLELGRYKGVRAHLRLFPFEGFTFGAAHVEFLPEGGFEHQVVSWELGEDLVSSELVRTGFVRSDPVRIGPFRTGLTRRIGPDMMRAVPMGLANMADLSVQGGEATDIPGSGFLTALELVPLVPAEGERSWTRVHLDLSTEVPNPGVADRDASLRVQGPLRMEQELVTRGGSLQVRLAIRGSLAVGGDMIGEVAAGQVARMRSRTTRAARLDDYRVLAGVGRPPAWRTRIRSRLTSGRTPVHEVGDGR